MRRARTLRLPRSGSLHFPAKEVNWNQVQKRIRRLIDDGKYLSAEEQDYLHEYETKQLARSVYTFQYYIDRTPMMDRPWDANAGAMRILPLLSDPVKAKELYDQMFNAWVPLRSDFPHYDALRAPLRDMGMYVRGEYSLFTPLPEEVLEAERRIRQVGYFMERVFPLYNVRFISVNDGYDSSDYQGDTGGMNVAFKYLAAEFYSRDLSIKSTTAKMVKMKRGEYQSKICMYGYKKGADGRMEPDEETAPNVCLIFDLASQGKSTRQISQILRERGVCTPGEYKAARGIAQHDVSRSAGTWQSDTLMRVLRDERYTGTYIIGKRHVTEVGSSRNRLRDESDWIKIPDHHPALVSREIYDEVQEKIKRRPSVKRKTTAYPLRQKVYCGCCRHAMPRSGSKNYLFYCRFTKSNADAACHDLSIRESELEDALYAVLSKQAQVILNVHDLSDAGVLKSCLAEQTDYGNKVEGLKARKAALYEQLVLGEISQEEYRERKAEIDKELMRVEQVYDALSTQSSQMQMDADTKKASRKLAQEITDADGLTAALAGALIERVYVYPGNRLDIEWKSNDFCRED